MQLVSISKYINESQLRSNWNRYPDGNSKENSIYEISFFFLLRFDNLFYGSKKRHVLLRNRIEITMKYNVNILEYWYWFWCFSLLRMLSISEIVVIIDFSKFLIVDVPTQCMTTSFSYQRISVKISCTKTSGCPQQNAYEH